MNYIYNLSKKSATFSTMLISRYINKIKLNTFLILGISAFIIFPPYQFLYKRNANVILSKKPYYHMFVAKSPHEEIVFPNNTFNDLILNNDRFYCIDTNFLLSEINKGDSINVVYSKSLMYGFMGELIILQLEYKGTLLVDELCLKNKRMLFEIGVFIVLTIGIIRAVYPKLKNDWV